MSTAMADRAYLRRLTYFISILAVSIGVMYVTSIVLVVIDEVIDVILIAMVLSLS